VTEKPEPTSRTVHVQSKVKRTADVPAEAAPATKPGLVRGWVRFWFAAVDPIGLHIARVLTGLLLLSWLLPLAGQIDSLLGLEKWFDARAFAEAGNLTDGALAPSWSVLYLFGPNPVALKIVFWVAIAVMVAFTLGIYPRLTALLSWILVASFTANPIFEYEGDGMLLMLTFYLMIGYLFSGQRAIGQSLLARLSGPLLVWPLGRRGDREDEAAPSMAANLALRLIQVHLALILVTSGLHKLQFGDWWAGVGLWFPLHPAFRTSLADAQAHKADADLYLYLLNIGGYATLAWQLGFPLFAWRRAWRFVLLGGAAIGWIGSALIWHQPVVGPAILIGCLAFVSSAGWRKLFAFTSRLRRGGESLASAD
jgi:hypothetical protein